MLNKIFFTFFICFVFKQLVVSNSWALVEYELDNRVNRPEGDSSEFYIEFVVRKGKDKYTIDFGHVYVVWREKKEVKSLLLSNLADLEATRFNLDSQYPDRSMYTGYTLFSHKSDRIRKTNYIDMHMLYLSRRPQRGSQKLRFDQPANINFGYLAYDYVDALQYAKSRAQLQKWKSVHKEWSLKTNCSDFANDIASTIGLATPDIGDFDSTKKTDLVITYPRLWVEKIIDMNIPPDNVRPCSVGVGQIPEYPDDVSNDSLIACSQCGGDEQ